MSLPVLLGRGQPSVFLYVRYHERQEVRGKVGRENKAFLQKNKKIRKFAILSFLNRCNLFGFAQLSKYL